MGEETKTLTNESIDIPLLEEYQKPILTIKQSEEPDASFSIKLNFNGLELKKTHETICSECCQYSYNCNCCKHTFIRKIVVSTSHSSFRIRFDNEKPLTYTCGVGYTIITFPNETIELMKGKKKMIIEVMVNEHGKLWYEFNIEGLENICEENNVYKFRTPIQKTINDTPTYYETLTKGSENITSYIILTIIFVCFVIWLISLYNEKPVVTNLPLQESKDTIITNQPLSANLVDLSITDKKEKSKIKPKPNHEIEIKETKEEVSEIKTQSEFVQPTNDVVLSKEDNVTPTKEEPIQITNSLNVNDYPTYQVKKKGLLKRLFSKN
jgi:hypothetical protein